MTSSQPKQYVQNISCIFPPSSQMGGLYLGNIYGAQNQAILQEYGIRAVVSLAPQKKFKYNPLKIPFFKKVEAHDTPTYDILSEMPSCINFIEKHRKVTNVYVHCFAGVSRSATLVIGYLIKAYGMQLNEASQLVRFKRVVAKPNSGFLDQLQLFEESLSRPKGLILKDKENIVNKKTLEGNKKNKRSI